MDSRNNQKNKKENRYYWLGLRIATDFGATIAIPALFALWIGKKISTKYGHSTIVVLSLLAVSFILTAIIIYRKAKRYAQEYERQ